jgi:hypothetical protein
MSAKTDKAQSDPWSVLYDDIASFTSGNVPSREDVEATVVAVAVLAEAAPAVVAALILVIALIDAYAWLASKLGAEDYCQHPPIDTNDVRWLHFGDDSAVSWPEGTISSGPWSNFKPGSFEAWAFPVLALNWEYRLNCRAFIDYRELLSRLVDAWNKTHLVRGDEAAVNTAVYQLPVVQAPGGPPVIYRAQWPMTVKIVSGAPPSLPPWQHVSGTFGDFTFISTDDHTIVVNRGPASPHLHLPPGPLQGASTGTKVAAGAAAVGGAAVVGTLVYAWATGKTIDAVLSRFWGAVKRAAHAK